MMFKDEGQGIKYGEKDQQKLRKYALLIETEKRQKEMYYTFQNHFCVKEGKLEAIIRTKFCHEILNFSIVLQFKT